MADLTKVIKGLGKCMDFGYCRLPDAPDVKWCWKKILTKWMEVET